MLSKQLQKLGYDTYQQYLETRHWQQFRKKVFKKPEVQRLLKKYNHFVCQFCEKERRLNVHHVTYIRLGHERLQDVYLICEDCHAQIHKLAEKLKISIRKATLLYKKRIKQSRY